MTNDQRPMISLSAIPIRGQVRRQAERIWRKIAANGSEVFCRGALPFGCRVANQQLHCVVHAIERQHEGIRLFPGLDAMGPAVRPRIRGAMFLESERAITM